MSEKKKFFSILVVALNPGEKLRETVDSVLCQSYGDYEIIVKDGGSRDGSLGTLPQDDRIRVFVEKDTGIYDAMNQAVAKAKGEYVLFLNCGDSFYDPEVLERAHACIEREKDDRPLIVYGDTFGTKNKVCYKAPAAMDSFACYRNIPCHQSCFYQTSLCREKPYDPKYRIRADYEHFLWCFFKAGAKMVHMGSVVAAYEGGGYSESKENQKRDKEEHRLITEAYLDKGKLLWYRMVMCLSLAPLRSFLAENRWTAGVYHGLCNAVKGHKKRMVAGLIVLVLELFFFFGTGYLEDEVSHYLTGEGAWQETLSEEKQTVCQVFRPSHKHLTMVSVLLGRENVTAQDGWVRVSIEDGTGQELFARELAFEELEKGKYTDIDVDLQLSPHRDYRLVVSGVPSSKGEAPSIGVCSTDFLLSENRELRYEQKVPEAQMVTRYCYQNAVELPNAALAVLICILTAFGIMFGLPDKPIVRLIVGILLMVIAPQLIGRRLERFVYNPIYYLPSAMKWNLALMYGLEFLVLLFTLSPGISVTLANIALTILYSANYFVNLYRGTSLHMNDLSAIGTAAEVAGEFSFRPTMEMALAWGLTGLFAVYGIRAVCGKGKKKKAGVRAGWLVRLCSMGVAVVLILVGGKKVLYTDFFNDRGFADEDYRGYAYELIYLSDGFLVGTLIDVKNSRFVKPEDYSVEAVEAILQDYREQDEPEEDLPHVIVVMNESFTDIEAITDIEIDGDPLEFVHSMSENTVKGFVNVSTIGGGTANSEFELLTGCTMAFLSANYYPYQQAIKQPMPSLVSHMEGLGYTTVAMHPELGRNWNRNVVYPRLGFDQIYFQEDFEGSPKIHFGYSDSATYQKIIDLYEAREEGEKLFVFDVTSQNHGGYFEEDIPITVTAPNKESDQLDEFLSLMDISDAAFEELVAYFEKQDEKVVICFFGDHQPGISNRLVKEHPKADADPNQNNVNAFRTPFVIWANYDIEEAEGHDISTNYLGGLLLETAGIPQSPFFAYLSDLRGEYPVITRNIYKDMDGNYYNWSSDEAEFMDYRMLQINYLFDSGTVEGAY